jgi:hypothetical protein
MRRHGGTVKKHVVDTGPGVLTPREAAMADAVQKAIGEDPPKGLAADAYPDTGYTFVWDKMCVYICVMPALAMTPTVVRLSLDMFKDLLAQVTAVEQLIIVTTRQQRGEKPKVRQAPGGTA